MAEGTGDRLAVVALELAQALGHLVLGVLDALLGVGLDLIALALVLEVVIAGGLAGGFLRLAAQLVGLVLEVTHVGLLTISLTFHQRR